MNYEKSRSSKKYYIQKGKNPLVNGDGLVAEDRRIYMIKKLFTILWRFIKTVNQRHNSMLVSTV